MTDGLIGPDYRLVTIVAPTQEMPWVHYISGMWGHSVLQSRYPKESKEEVVGLSLEDPSNPEPSGLDP